MRLSLVTPPEKLPVTLEEAKAHLRVEDDHQDVLISSLIETAVARLDGRNGLLGRALTLQSWRLSLDAFTRQIEIPLPPCRSIDSVAFTDPAGVNGPVDPGLFAVAGLGDPDGALVALRPGKCWPAVACGPATVRIGFTAGYKEASDVPAPIRAAILTHLAHLFEHREAVTTAESSRLTPMGWADLVFDYRVPGL